MTHFKLFGFNARSLLGMVLVAAAGGQCGARAENPGHLLLELKSPVILKGDGHTAFRDPLLAYNNGRFYLFYSYVREEEDHLIYWYVGESTSRDLQHWSKPRVLTPKGQNLNYASPGSLTRVGGEWVLCFDSYPIVGMHRGDPLRFARGGSHLFLSRSRDLTHWSAPEVIRIDGPEVSPKQMANQIDPFIFPDKDVKGKWWCFYKEGGAIHSAWSMDLKTWTPQEGTIVRGENPDVLVQKSGYVLFYAPQNGIGVLRSSNLKTWRRDGQTITLGQQHWPWAETRLTAGYVADLRKVPGVGAYVLVCHSMGPGKQKTDANTNANCSIVIAWSDDLKVWHWPGESEDASTTAP